MTTEILLREFKSLPEQLQSHVIDYILGLKIAQKKQSNGQKKKTRPARKAGWGKEMFLFVAPDFDATPPGFEEYMPAA